MPTRSKLAEAKERLAKVKGKKEIDLFSEKYKDEIEAEKELAERADRRDKDWDPENPEDFSSEGEEDLSEEDDYEADFIDDEEQPISQEQSEEEEESIESEDESEEEETHLFEGPPKTYNTRAKSAPVVVPYKRTTEYFKPVAPRKPKITKKPEEPVLEKAPLSQPTETVTPPQETKSDDVKKD